MTLHFNLGDYSIFTSFLLELCIKSNCLHLTSQAFMLEDTGGSNMKSFAFPKLRIWKLISLKLLAYSLEKFRVPPEAHIPQFEDCYLVPAVFYSLTSSFHCSIGHCSGGRNECIQGSERSLHGHHWISCGPSAPVPSDTDDHRCWEKLDNCLPSAHRYVARHRGGKTVSHVGRDELLPSKDEVGDQITP